MTISCLSSKITYRKMDPIEKEDNYAGKDEQILHLIDMPYESEDEVGQVIDENEFDVDISDEQLFSQLDEVLINYLPESNEGNETLSGDSNDGDQPIPTTNEPSTSKNKPISSLSETKIKRGQIVKEGLNKKNAKKGGKA
ncbi:hypothetical protein J6590_090016 [Homalodisca vitripennis]|nr:hypothetical protein J6590_090016 [Homalodisca vitripennis]